MFLTRLKSVARVRKSAVVGELREHLQLAAGIQRPNLVERLVRHRAHVATVEPPLLENVAKSFEEKIYGPGLQGHSLATLLAP